MESIYPELALCGSKNECARTETVFSPISEVSEGTVSSKYAKVCNFMQGMQKLAQIFKRLQNLEKNMQHIKLNLSNSVKSIQLMIFSWKYSTDMNALIFGFNVLTNKTASSGPLRQFKTTLNNLEHFRTILHHIGQLWTFLNHFRPFWTIWTII